MDTDGRLQLIGFTATGNTSIEATLSGDDCAAAGQTNMAKLAG